MTRFPDASAQIRRLIEPRIKHIEIFDKLAFSGHAFELTGTAAEYFAEVEADTNACTQHGIDHGMFEYRTLFRPDRLKADVAIHELGHALDWYLGLRHCNNRLTRTRGAYLSENSPLWRSLCNELMRGTGTEDPIAELVAVHAYGELFAEWFFICQVSEPGFEHYNILSQARIAAEMNDLIEVIRTDSPWKMPVML